MQHENFICKWYVIKSQAIFEKEVIIRNRYYLQTMVYIYIFMLLQLKYIIFSKKDCVLCVKMTFYVKLLANHDLEYQLMTTVCAVRVHG
jgi:hypothetical protein